MATISIDSPAFRQASLRSERLRTIGLIVVVVIMVCVVVARALVLRGEAYLQILPAMLLLLAGLGVYELFRLRGIARAIRADREPPPWTWVVSVLVETSAPTLAILIMTFSEGFGPYRALVAPACLTYFFFIILATLRLSLLLCLLTGLFAAAGYLAVAGFTFWRYPDAPTGAFALPIYGTYAVCFLVGGMAAGGVARQIRTHVIAALREAEARQQVERLEHDLSIARSIQQGLLPRRLPSIPGFDIAGWSQPADETGGDYYDWQELSGGRLVVSLADVTGHGIGPALVTAVCRAYARASFLGEGDLGSLTDRMHRLLAEDLPPGRFVTFVAALLDPALERVQMLSAGHGPIFVYSAEDNHVQAHNADDLPFGVVPDNAYGPARAVDLRAGDLLVLMTDGFFEWPNEAGEQVGTQRLAECIRVARHLPAAEMIQSLYAAVIHHVGGVKQQDDLTAVVIKRLGA